MIVVEPILRGVLVPVAVTAAILLLAGRPWRRHETAGRRWAAGVAIGAGFLSAEIALHGRPVWHPQENWQWLAHASFVGLILGIVDCRPTRLRWWIILLRAVVCAAAAYVLVPDFPDLEDTRLYWIAGLPLVSLLTWVTLNQSSVRLPNSAILVILLFSYAAACLLLAYYSSNAKFGQLMGVLVASTGALLIVNLWHRNAVHLAGVAPLVALIFPGAYIGSEAAVGHMLCAHGNATIEHHCTVGHNVLLSRMGLRLHLLMCSDCRRYAKQLRALGAYARNRWGPQTEDSDTLQRLEREILERPKPKGPPEGLA